MGDIVRLVKSTGPEPNESVVLAIREVSVSASMGHVTGLLMITFDPEGRVECTIAGDVDDALANLAIDRVKLNLLDSDSDE